MGITQAFAPLLGYIVDHIGAPHFVTLMSSCAMIGMSLVAVGINVESTEFLLYIGFTVMSTCTWMGSLTIVQLGFYFQGHTASRVIFFLNTLFDAGALTYWFLWFIQKQTSGSVTHIWYGYMAMAAVIYAVLIFLWRAAVPAPPPPSTEDGLGELVLLASRHSALLMESHGSVFERMSSSRFSISGSHAFALGNSSEFVTSHHSSPMIALGNSSEFGKSHYSAPVRSRSVILQPYTGQMTSSPIDKTRVSMSHSQTLAEQYPHLVYKGRGSFAFRQSTHLHAREIAAACNSETAHDTSHALVDDEEEKDDKDVNAISPVAALEQVNVKQQLTQPAYLLICLFFAIQVTSTNWNFYTQRDFLSYLGDDEEDNRYLTIFTLLTPVSIIGAPLIDYCIVHHGWVASLQVVSVLGVAYQIVKVSSTDLNIQIIGFVIFSFYRSFLFGVCFSFVPTLVEGPVIGTACGIMAGLPGVMGFLSIPMATLAVNHFDGDFFWPNIIYLTLQIPCIMSVVALGVQMAMKEDEDSEKQSKDDDEASEEKM
jgi:hypothetical protein